MIISAILAAAVSLPAPADIQKTLDTFVQEVPGVVTVVGTIDRGQTHIYTAGKPPAGAPALNGQTEFQIGSITKTFTATMLAEMTIDKRVQLSSPISRFLPKSVHAPAYQSKQITLLNLAEQNSGLPRLAGNMDDANDADPYASYSTQQLYDFISGYTLTRAPGAQYEYSNLGVGLLGQLLSNRANTSYDQLVQALVFKPLGMTRTSATLTPAMRANMMPGFAEDLTPAQPWTFGTATAGAGAINSTVDDMMLYLRANMEAPQGKMGDAMAMAHKPRASLAPNVPTRIGLVWMTTKSGVTWHNGETGGYASFLGFNHEIGIVILTNIASNNVTALGTHLLESSAMPNVPNLQPPPTAHGNSPYVGVYELAPSFKITVFEEDGTLYGQGTGQPRFKLVPQSGDTYKVEGIDATVTFNRDASGKVTSLVLHQNGRDLPGKRVSP
jgi:CubicO group peptidase (beta-lactamase class C family)